jgi:hypothetical protein
LMSCYPGLMDLDYCNHYSCQSENESEKADDGFESGGG